MLKAGRANMQRTIFRTHVNNKMNEIALKATNDMAQMSDSGDAQKQSISDPPSQTSPLSIDDQLAELRNEIALLKRCT